MSLNPRAIATLGIGYGPRLVAGLGVYPLSASVLVLAGWRADPVLMRFVRPEVLSLGARPVPVFAERENDVLVARPAQQTEARQPVSQEENVTRIAERAAPSRSRQRATTRRLN